MNKEKRLRLLILPLIFMILLFVPGMILDIAPDDFIQGMPDVLWNIFLAIKWPALIIWTVLFYYIPTSVYIAIVAVYTAVSWTWILRRRKGNAMYFIVWFVLCVLSILMYWKWGGLYHDIMNG